MTHLDLGPLHAEPVNIRPPFHLPRALNWDTEANRADFLNAIHEPLLGVVLGAYDQRMIRWLAGWDTPTVGTIVSLLHRARAAAPLPTGDPR